MKQERSFECVLRTLSPVHVGCGEVYEPTGFKVDKQKGRLVVFDPVVFVKALSTRSREELLRICSRGTVESVLDLYKFFDREPASGREVAVCEGFIRHHEKVLRLSRNEVRKELNRFEIQRTAYLSIDQRPYIPGSAVKGALRTAFLNMLADSESTPDYSKDITRLATKSAKKKRTIKPNEWLEEKLLRLDRARSKGERIQKDPFRLVKVSDFRPVGIVRTKIMYAINKKKDLGSQDESTIPQILEVIEPGSMFVGTIRIETPLGGSAVSMGIGLDELLESCTNFFGSEKRREEEELSKMGVQAMLKASNGSRLLRIGRHSGAECVTIKRYRAINVGPGGKGQKQAKGSTTLWLAAETNKPTASSKLLPFGWVSLEEISPQIREEITAKEIELQRVQSEASGGSTQQASAETGPAIEERSAEEIRAEQVADFKRMLDQVQNLPGEINGLINAVKAKEDLELRKDLCRLLLDRARALKKKNKFEKALEHGKKWAQQLKALCDELGVS